MRPIEKLLARFPNHKATGAGFSVCCPAHDDNTPSLSITEAENGTVLLKCFAGCSTEQVVAALDLRTADLFPVSRGEALPAGPLREHTVYGTADEAIAGYRRGIPDYQWPYVDANGTEKGRTVRWDTADGKVIRPIARRSGGWQTAAMVAPMHLYNLPGVLANETAKVFVAEGEKCAESLASLGLTATTSAGGSGAANKSDWSPLAGRDVVILPDNDEAGRRYAKDVRRILGGLQATVRISSLDGLLDEGRDVADLVDRCTDEGQRTALRDTIEQAAALEAPCSVAIEGQESPLADNPFPTDALPEVIRSIVVQAARSIGCDDAAIALPCLTGLGVACANWRVAIKEDWVAPPAVWAVVARSSGQQKSPALDVTLDYFRQRQEEICRLYNSRLGDGEQERPLTVWTDNATTEGLDDAFRRNPRGILYGCDELSGWLGTFGLYKNGRGTADEGWYCQRYSGRASNLVRKHGGPYVGCASGVLGVTGCTTIETLKSLLTRSVRDCGMMARLVICIAPARRRRWTDDTLPATARENYYGLLDRLFADKGHTVARLSAGAACLYREFFDRHNEEAEGLATDELKAAFSKLEELPARLALILHVAEEGSGPIPAETMTRAIRIGEWAKDETRRAYAILGSCPHGFSAPTPSSTATLPDDDYLLEWIRRKGPASARTIQTGCRRFRDSAGRAKAVLDQLVQRGVLTRTPDGHYSCADATLSGRESAIEACPTADTADTADVLTGEQSWTKV